MDELKERSEHFKIQYDRFLLGCDALEEAGLWNKDLLGEMDVFYENDLIGMILRLMAADGSFSRKEATFLSDMFGFRYAPEELSSIYDDCGDSVERLLDGELRSGLSVMRALNEQLAEVYKDLIFTACDIVIAKDGVLDRAELSLAQKIKQLAE